MRSSIIVVTYNHRPYIERCLEALRRSLGPSDEVILVDNASSDGTPDYVARRFPDVRLIRRADNPGFGAACNQAARLSEADFLVFLNPDTEPFSSWLDDMIQALRIPGVGLVSPMLILPGKPELVDALGHDMHISGFATCRHWGKPASGPWQVEEIAAISGACFGIVRSLFWRLDGFDERLFLYYEDDDLSLRARLAGFSCVAVPSARVVHDHTPGFSPEKLHYIERNRLWTMLKLFERQTLLSLLPALVVGEVLAWAMAFLNGPQHLVAKVRAWQDLLSWLRFLPAERSHVDRVVSDSHLLRLHSLDFKFDQVVSSRLARTAGSVVNAGFIGAHAIAAR